MTTYVDTFTGTNGTVLIGTTSASGQPFTGAGNWTISSNTALAPSGATPAFLLFDTAYTSFDIKVTFTSAFTGPGPTRGGVVFRYIDANNFNYLIITDTGRCRLYKVVGGVETQLGDTVPAGAITGHYVRVVTTGNSIDCYYDAALQYTVVDAANNTGTIGGIYSINPGSTSTYDDLTTIVPTQIAASDSLAFTSFVTFHRTGIEDLLFLDMALPIVNTTPNSPAQIAVSESAYVQKYTGGLITNLPSGPTETDPLQTSYSTREDISG